MRAAADGPVDLVVDPLCGRAGTAAVEALGEGGRLVQLGGSAGPVAELSSATVRSRSLSILGYTNNALSREQRRGALGALLRHAAEDGLTARHELVEWAGLPDAWARQAAGSAGARIVARLPR
jgi:NADPH:quinone reductase-like Zn-dependent oxidoreductase